MIKKQETSKLPANARTTFWATTSELIKPSASLMLSLARFLSFATLIKAAQGFTTPPNPLNFLNKGTLYTVGTFPNNITQGYTLAWEAYQSVANKIINGSLGQITQVFSNIAYNGIYNLQACEAYIGITSNASGSAIEAFRDNFYTLLRNDPAFQAAAANCPYLSDGEQVAIAFGASVGIIVMMVGCIIGIATACNYRDERAAKANEETGSAPTERTPLSASNP